MVISKINKHFQIIYKEALIIINKGGLTGIYLHLTLLVIIDAIHSFRKSNLKLSCGEIIFQFILPPLVHVLCHSSQVPGKVLWIQLFILGTRNK